MTGTTTRRMSPTASKIRFVRFRSGWMMSTIPRAKANPTMGLRR